MSTLQAPLDKLREAAAEQRFVLRSIEWPAYRAISEALTGRHVHLAYDQGDLEFMTTSGLHANYSRLLARFTVVLAEEFHVPIRSFGDMTCNRQDLNRGLDPDECFYLRHEPLMRGKDEVDLAVDPPPDLAQEIEITRSFVSRLRICEALRIPEVWRFNGETLRAYHLSSGHAAVPHPETMKMGRVAPSFSCSLCSGRRSIVAWCFEPAEQCDLDIATNPKLSPPLVGEHAG
jgi:Uma2 family endonuclease